MSYTEEIQKIQELSKSIDVHLGDAKVEPGTSAETAYQSAIQRLTPVRQQLKQIKATLDQFVPIETTPEQFSPKPKVTRRRTRKSGPSENKL